MRATKATLTAILLLSALEFSWAKQYTNTPYGIKANVCGMDIEVRFYSPEIVRITKRPEGSEYKKSSFSVIKEPENVPLGFSTYGDYSISAQSMKIDVAIDLKTGKITYKELSSGRQLLAEKDYGAQFTPLEYGDDTTYLVRQAFMLDKDEPIYGLGQHQKGRMNQRNQMIHLRQDNKEICIPYMMSLKGYALFWDNTSPTTFTDNPMETAFDSQYGDCIDYYFIYGQNADETIKGMRELTGQVQMNALWTYGYWQSRERYKSQEELLDVVRRYRSLGVPLDGIIQDWQYWGTDTKEWNAIEFRNPQFPDPKKMVDDVHGLNAHIITSVWPTFGQNTEPYRIFKEKGMLLDFKALKNSTTYDAFNPEARRIYWDFINRYQFSIGVDGWWLDATEPEFYDKDDKLDIKTHAGLLRKVFNAFPISTVGGVHDHQRAVTSDKRVFILTRSAFAGQQRYGATSWSGDIWGTWDVLRDQIPAGLNFSLCGLPYWNTDIGGFFVRSGKDDPAYRELYVRWLQFGTFTPMMRSHGTGTPREIYVMGDRGSWEFNTIEKYIDLRYRLLPYIYSTAWSVTSNSDTYMRALVMDFPRDSNVYDLGDQYMFGRSLLIAPVTEPMYVDMDKNVDTSAVGSRQIYLPEGCEWFDFWTGERFDGGRSIVRDTPIDIIPVYVKAGSILPIGPEVQYAAQKRWDRLEIRVYPGQDGMFVLYEDENDNYNYEQGVYSTITFQWDDATGTLTIGDREGSFPGMLKRRKFDIVLAGSGRGIGDRTETEPDKTVSYNGRRITVKL